MADKISEKVINLFKKHKKESIDSNDEKVVRNEDGFFYVCITKDENGLPFDKERVISRAADIHYVVKIMITNFDNPHIYNYQVPAEKILEFLAPYINKEKDGKIIEIDKYYPHDLA